MTTRTSQGAIAWVTSLMMFPYIALPSYWIFGRSKFYGIAQALSENEHEIELFLKQVKPKIQANFVPTKKRVPEYDALVKLTEMGMTDHNKTELLIDGEETYNSIIDGILSAKNYILVEFYIVRDDRVGRRLKDALIKSAKKGIQVYFIYDEIGSKDLPSSFKKELRGEGVEFYPFNTTRGWRNRFQLNFRNHRKIVVVDGQSAWIGGLNIGEDYLGENPKLTPWRDTHLKILGPAALQTQIVFLADWYWATRKIPKLNWTAKNTYHDTSEVMIIASSPANKLETAGLFFTHAISCASERIWIATPYFIPDESQISALQLASLRGVDVRIILPKKSDNFLIKPASYFYMEKLIETGIEFYEFNKGFMHQKVMLIDDDITTIGTANFDIRSFRLNFEITSLIRSHVFALHVQKMLKDDIKNSEKVKLDYILALPYWRRALHRIARLFSPIL